MKELPAKKSISPLNPDATQTGTALVPVPVSPSYCHQSLSTLWHGLIRKLLPMVVFQSSALCRWPPCGQGKMVRVGLFIYFLSAFTSSVNLPSVLLPNTQSLVVQIAGKWGQVCGHRAFS